MPDLIATEPLKIRHYLFIVNPAAGKKHRPNLPDLIRAAVTSPDHPDTCDIVETEQPGHAKTLAADFARQFGEQTIVVACGGDGTAHEIANGLIGTPAAFTILPLGTGNDFARAFLSSLDLDVLLSRLTRPDIRPIDLIRVNDRICLNITSFGFDTRVQRLMMGINRRIRFLGLLSYPLAIVIALLGKKRFSFTCTMQGHESQHEQAAKMAGNPVDNPADIPADSPADSPETVDYILAALCNGRFYGGGFNPAPKARIDDGQIELVLVDPLPLRRILGLIPRYKQGTHLNDPAVHLLPVTAGTIAALPGQNLLGNTDGELFETTRLDFEILPGAVRFAFY